MKLSAPTAPARPATTAPPSSPQPSPAPAPGATAIVIAGAVAQGAFGAGALDVLVRQQLPIARIVATSSGALSGTLLAAGLRTGRARDAVGSLVHLWTHSAHWANAISLSPRDLLRARGLSSSRKLRQVLRHAVESLVPGGQYPVDLRLVTTALSGAPSARRDGCATSFESVVSFSGPDFDDADARERLYAATTASAAFPGLYAPVQVTGIGQCLDGGAVNNAPIKHALEGTNLRRVIVITNTPAIIGAPKLQGLDLAEHLVDVLIHERLYRDLREARAVNHQLAHLEQLVAQRVLSPALHGAVMDALGWRCKRRLELIEIRPANALRGGAFSGLADQGLREEYIAEGRRAAEDALARVAGVTAAAP